jgi:hypothetical protein
LSPLKVTQAGLLWVGQWTRRFCHFHSGVAPTSDPLATFVARRNMTATSSVTGLPPANATTLTMHPTVTEHDFRFPRRPFDNNPAGPYGGGTGERMTGRAANMRFSGGQLAASTRAKADPSPSGGFQVNISRYGGSTDHELLSSAMFPVVENGMSGNLETLEQMQQNDPLATQVWRFFSRTKQNLPAQERMENLTWRMMHMKLRKGEQAQLAGQRQSALGQRTASFEYVRNGAVIMGGRVLC